MGFKRTSEGRVFFQSFDDKPSGSDKLKTTKAANPLPQQAENLKAGLQAQSLGTQTQILTLLKTLNEKLKLTQNERNQMREELDAYRRVIEGLEEKSDRSERAYLSLQQKISKGGVEGSSADLLKELENTRKLIFDLEDKTTRADKHLEGLKKEITQTKALSDQVSKRQSNLEAAHKSQAGKITEQVTNYAMLVKRVRDGEQVQENLLEKVDETVAQQAKLTRKMDKALEDRARFMRKIERIEETVLQTRDSLNAKAMVLLTDQGVAGHIDADSAEMAAQLAALQAQHGAPAVKPQSSFWRKIYTPQTIGVSALVVMALLAGLMISDVQKPQMPDFDVFENAGFLENAPAQADNALASADPQAAWPEKDGSKDWSVETDISAYSENPAPPADAETTTDMAAPNPIDSAQDDLGAIDLNNTKQLERLLEEDPAALAAALNDLEPSSVPEEATAPPVTFEEQATPEAEITQPLMKTVPAPEKPAIADENLSKLMAADSSLKGVIKDIETQAFAGVPEAQHDLAAVYTAGHGGVAQNYERAAFWFEQAADRGVANAAYNLGVLNHQGLGMKPDMDKAIKWYDRAAQLGHPEAQYNLGIAYIEGIGVPYDPEKASGYFKSAAQNNIMEAAYNLGLIYENGLLGDAKPDEALMWYKLAADQGSPEAKQALQQLAESLDISLDDVNKLAESMKVLKKTEASPRPKAATTKAATPKAATAVSQETPQPLASAVNSTQLLTAQVQEYLMNAGLYPGPADGISGPLTNDAVRSYQNKNGLNADGRITQSLLTHMLSNEELAQGSRL